MVNEEEVNNYCHCFLSQSPHHVRWYIVQERLDLGLFRLHANQLGTLPVQHQRRQLFHVASVDCGSDVFAYYVRDGSRSSGLSRIESVATLGLSIIRLPLNPSLDLQGRTGRICGIRPLKRTRGKRANGKPLGHDDDDLTQQDSSGGAGVY